MVEMSEQKDLDMSWPQFSALFRIAPAAVDRAHPRPEAVAKTVGGAGYGRGGEL